MQVEVSPHELIYMIGEREIIIRNLRLQVEELEAKLKEANGRLEQPNNRNAV